MTTEEASKILSVLTSAYPKRICHDEVQGLIRLWAAVFADVPYSEVGEAVMSFIRSDTKGYMPVPGQILDLVHTARMEKESRVIVEKFYNLQQNCFMK